MWRWQARNEVALFALGEQVAHRRSLLAPHSFLAGCAPGLLNAAWRQLNLTIDGALQHKVDPAQHFARVFKRETAHVLLQGQTQ